MNPNERFFDKVDQSAGPDSCWLWTGYRNNRGYGVIKRDGKPELAHRVSFQIYAGEIPDGMIVMHACDTPACVNPAHLALGTASDNSRDCTSKHRQACGEKNGDAKLTAGQVDEIRSSYNREAGRTLKYLAHQFGVCHAQIWNIVRGRCWRHL